MHLWPVCGPIHMLRQSHVSMPFGRLLFTCFMAECSRQIFFFGFEEDFAVCGSNAVPRASAGILLSELEPQCCILTIASRSWPWS